MWKPGKWVYAPDQPDPTNEADLPSKSKLKDSKNSSEKNKTSSINSPPWKLNQELPLETVIFKDGRRMSKRFQNSKSIPSNTPTNNIPSNSSQINLKRNSIQSNRHRRQSNSSLKSKSISPFNLDSINQIDQFNENSKCFSSDLISPTNTTTNHSNSIIHQSFPLNLSENLHSNLQINSIINHPYHLHSNNTLKPNLSINQLPLSPPSTSHSTSHPPPKKFKPWEALKSIETDSNQVAHDIKLIHQRQSINHNQSSSSSSSSNLTSNQLLKSKSIHSDQNLSLDSIHSNQSNPSNHQNQNSNSKRHSLRSLSSDLTELSSSLSDLSDQHSISSSSSSIIYSEFEIDDDCLPQTLVRTIKRPSKTNSSSTTTLKWKRRRSVALHRQRRALRSLAKNFNPLDQIDLEPPPYIKIKSNVYPYRKPEISELPPPLCSCTEGGCNEKCLNRIMFYLCDPKRCRLGQSCSNIPFNQRKDIIDESTHKLGKGLKVFYTGPQRGWGLKTEIKLKKGMFVIDYRGEIISRENCYKRVVTDYREMKDFYFLDYDGSDVIDAGKKGNCSRFINHSCEPNLKVERFKLSGLEEYQFGLFTLRDIEIDEELSYNYGWQNFSDIAPTSNIRTSLSITSPSIISTLDDESIRPTAPTVQRCYCGSKICKGFLSVKRSLMKSINAQGQIHSKQKKIKAKKSNPQKRRESKNLND
ncbi:hypothetical protein O181_067181 [Austropuccinia psidii MF-1]|uniref:SET domain-containing protein n=1 Tax=Austropuccinia psidii MF-1 TaxID=1389203 RepID=A0A9Q3EZ37_9BASI|nr:hypothetical protein [Austropuccinia psidii MF-1]